MSNQRLTTMRMEWGKERSTYGKFDLYAFYAPLSDGGKEIPIWALPRAKDAAGYVSVNSMATNVPALDVPSPLSASGNWSSANFVFDKARTGYLRVASVRKPDARGRIGDHTNILLRYGPDEPLVQLRFRGTQGDRMVKSFRSMVGNFSIIPPSEYDGHGWESLIHRSNGCRESAERFSAVLASWEANGSRPAPQKDQEPMDHQTWEVDILGAAERPSVVVQNVAHTNVNGDTVTVPVVKKRRKIRI